MDPEFHRRMLRAKNRDLEVHRVDDDPLIVEVDSGHSGRTHAVVPTAGYCSCEDRRYRRLPCWHLLHLATEPDVDPAIQDAVQSGIREHVEELREQIEKLSARAGTWGDAIEKLESPDPESAESSSETMSTPESRDSIARIANTVGGKVEPKDL